MKRQHQLPPRPREPHQPVRALGLALVPSAGPGSGPDPVPGSPAAAALCEASDDCGAVPPGGQSSITAVAKPPGLAVEW